MREIDAGWVPKGAKGHYARHYGTPGHQRGCWSTEGVRGIKEG